MVPGSTNGGGDDDEPVEGLRLEGTVADFEAAYLANRDLLHRVAAAALRPSGLESHAPDVVQEAVLSLWRRPPSAVTSWAALMVSTVKRRAVDLIKSANTRRSGVELAELAGRSEERAAVDIEAEFSATDERERQVARVRGAIQGLPDDERDVVERVFYGGETQAQVARARGVTEGRISQLKSAAFKRLAGTLDGKEVTP